MTGTDRLPISDVRDGPFRVRVDNDGVTYAPFIIDNDTGYLELPAQWERNNGTRWKLRLERVQIGSVFWNRWETVMAAGEPSVVAQEAAVQSHLHKAAEPDPSFRADAMDRWLTA